jgi:hypothetical protein
MVEKRKKTRHTIRDFVKKSHLLDKIYLEIDIEHLIRARIVDLSLNGVGFEIDNLEENQIEKFRKLNAMFVKIFFDSDAIFVEVEKIWDIITEMDGRTVLKGGFQFTVIASEDRIKLSKLIEEIRKTL